MSADEEWLERRRAVLAFRSQLGAWGHPSVTDPGEPKGRTCGHVATYNAGCRCKACRTAVRDKQRECRSRKAAS